MIGYLTLQQSQAEMERLVVEMVQAGVSQEKLEELFPGLLEGLPDARDEEPQGPGCRGRVRDDG